MAMLRKPLGSTEDMNLDDPINYTDPTPPAIGPGVPTGPGATPPPVTPPPAATPPPTTGGFDRIKFRDNWMANGDHSAAGLQDFIKAHPDYATGVTAGGSSGDKITLPGFNDNGIYRGPENLDAIIDAGGANKAGWTGPYKPGATPGNPNGTAGGGGNGLDGLMGNLNSLMGSSTSSTSKSNPADIAGALKGLFPNGAFNQDIVDRRTEGARENLQRYRRSQNDTNRAALASRGLLGSGPEQTAQDTMEGRIADQYTNAASGIYADESANADKRMMGALQLAGGMSEQDAQHAIDLFRAQSDASLGQGNIDLGYTRAGNDFTLGQGNLALGNSRNANDYNLGLADFGLRRDAEQNKQGNLDTQQLIDLINQYYQGTGLSTRGYPGK